jgi:hypothetical protein
MYRSMIYQEDETLTSMHVSNTPRDLLSDLLPETTEVMLEDLFPNTAPRQQALYKNEKNLINTVRIGWQAISSTRRILLRTAFAAFDAICSGIRLGCCTLSSLSRLLENKWTSVSPFSLGITFGHALAIDVVVVTVEDMEKENLAAEPFQTSVAYRMVVARIDFPNTITNAKYYILQANYQFRASHYTDSDEWSHSCFQTAVEVVINKNKYGVRKVILTHTKQDTASQSARSWDLDSLMGHKVVQQFSNFSAKIQPIKMCNFGANEWVRAATQTRYGVVNTLVNCIDIRYKLPVYYIWGLRGMRQQIQNIKQILVNKGGVAPVSAATQTSDG